MNKRTIAILIPAHNEEIVIAETIKTISQSVAKRDIYLVSDASKDKTVRIANLLLGRKNVINLRRNRGKAGALNYAIKRFQLPDKYKYIFPIDADTVFSSSFLKKSLRKLKNDKKGEIICTLGRVVGKDSSWITAYRLWEYEFSQSIYKNAQNHLGAIVVCPGCSTIYRSRIFKITKYPEQTVAEDMDLTFEMHRKKLGKIVFVPDAIVITQDPNTLGSFIKQINRWYRGFWQSVSKHKIPWGGQMLDLEVALLATEGLINSVLVITILLLAQLFIFKSSKLFLYALTLDFLFFMIPTLAFTIGRTKKLNMLKYIPHFYFLRVVSSLVFFKSFLEVIWGSNFGIGWNTQRYLFSKRN